MNIKIKFLSGPYKDKTMPLENGRKISFGRMSDNTVRISSDYVSRHHAIIELKGSAIRVMDLGARNTTRLNGSKIPPNVSVLASLHDVVQIGDTLIAIIEDHGSSIPDGLKGLEVESHFKGQLGQINMVEVLQFLNKSASTGTLYVDSSLGARGQIFMDNGEIISARWKGKGIDPLKALSRCIEVCFGDFVFIPGDSKSNINPSEIIKCQFEHLIIDVVRQIDELEYISKTTMIGDVKLKLPTETSGEVLTPLENKVYYRIYQQVLSREISINDIMDESFVSDTETYQVVLSLIKKGFLETRFHESHNGH
jgi:hypothetical protein